MILKVYVKTKYDNTLKMEIPHSPNIAIAMYGFREMGAELVPYHEISDIYSIVKREDIVLDYIDQCKTIFNKFNIAPNIPNYPEELKNFLGRKIWEDTIDNISADESKWSAGWFIKPKREKAFTGKIISSIHDLVGCGNSTENYEVLCSEPLDIRSEWRCFILHDEIIDIRPYGLLMDNTKKETPSWYYHYDTCKVKKMLEAFKTIPNRPAACSMDIAVVIKHTNQKVSKFNDNGELEQIGNRDIKEEQTVLIEFNDCYALGNYGLPSIYYAKMISARWSQLLGVKDNFNF